VAVGVLVIAATSVVIVGVAGLEAWVQTLGSIAALPAIGSLSVFGLFANLFGDTAAATIASWLSVALLACGACVLGWRSRARDGLAPALFGAASASLLISPHLFAQDLALLIPPLAALMARTASSHRWDRALAWGVVGCCVSLAAEYQFLPLGFQRADVLLPLLLLFAVVASLAATAPAAFRRPQRRTAEAA
jgi:hypothetical protein